MFYSVSEAQGKQGERCPETPSCIEGENKPWFLGKGAWNGKQGVIYKIFCQ